MAHQHLWRAATSRSIPVFVAAATTSLGNNNRCFSKTDCSAAHDAAAPNSVNADKSNTAASSSSSSSNSGIPPVFREGFQPKEEGYYADLFPKRQLWQPKFEYPQWDFNWDGRHPQVTGDKDEDRRKLREIRKSGITRHIILIRHGQYDESQKEDELRRLTAIGKLQAELTGKRLAEIMTGVGGGDQHDDVAALGTVGPSKIKSLRVSALTRAKETADIIAKHLPGVTYAEPDPLLNEGRPCHHIPGTRANEKCIILTDDHHRRIEHAYQKYFYRSEEFPSQTDTAVVPTTTTMTRMVTSGVTTTRAAAAAGVEDNDYHKHEFEIIVCHANVIRYFLCRALQLPPEAWLRYCPFNCSMTYITIRPSGSVSCRMLGDIGHLPHEASTFSKHVGFNW